MSASDLIIPKPDSRSVSTFVAAYRKYYIKNSEKIDARLKPRDDRIRLIREEEERQRKFTMG